MIGPRALQAPIVGPRFRGPSGIVSHGGPGADQPRAFVSIAAARIGLAQVWVARGWVQPATAGRFAEARASPLAHPHDGRCARRRRVVHVMDVVFAWTAALQALAAYLALRRSQQSPQTHAFEFLAFALVAGALASVVAAHRGSTNLLQLWGDLIALTAATVVAAGLWGQAVAVEQGGGPGILAQAAAEGLHRTTRRLEAAFRGGPDALLVCTPEGVIVDSNIAAESVLQIPRERLRGVPVAKVIAILDDRSDRIALSFAGRVSGELAGTREYRVKTSEGRTLWLEVDSKPLVSRGEKLVLVSARDVTERKAAAERVRRERARWALLVDALPAFAWTTDANLRVTSARGRGIEVLGISAESAVGRTLSEIYGQLGLPVPRNPLHARALGGETVPMRWRVRGMTYEGALFGVRDQTGRVVEVVGIALDVSGRERARQEAGEQEGLLRAILDQAPASVFIKDLDGGHLWVNREWERIGHTPRERIIGKTDFDLYTRAFAEECARNDREVLAGGKPIQFVEKLTGRSGRVRSYLSTKFVLRDESGAAYGLCGIATDDTARVALEEELRHRDALLEEAQTMAGLASWEWDLASGRHYWAPQFYQLFGLDPAASRPEEAFVSSIEEEDRPRVLAAAQAALQEGQPYAIEYRVRRTDGALRWIHAQGRVERGAGGSGGRFFGFVQDVTDGKEAAENISSLNVELEGRVSERTSQLERAVGELDSFSYAVSHDLRQPLRSISGYLALTKDDDDSLDDTARHYLELVGTAVHRMDAIIADLLVLSRVSHAALARSEIDFTAAAERVAGRIAAGDPTREIVWSVEQGLRVHADESLLELILTNLLGNAFKFTRRRPVAHVDVGCEGDSGEKVFFVRDDGTGFDPDFAGHLFEPFQRLHDTDDFEGNGMGLATVARVVRRHGGWVRAEGCPGEGTTIRFTLAAACSDQGDRGT